MSTTMPMRALRSGVAAVLVAFSLTGLYTAGSAHADSSDPGATPAASNSADSRSSASRSGRRPAAAAPSSATERQSGATARVADRSRPAAAVTGRSGSSRLAAAAGPVVLVPRPGASARTAPGEPTSAAAVGTAPGEPATAAPAVRPVVRTGASCGSCWAFGAVLPAQTIVTTINQFFDNAANWMSSLPASPIRDLLGGALLLVRRTFFNFHSDQIFGAAPASITFAELDTPSSALAVRVDKAQQNADAIKVDAGTTFTLTLPGPASGYTVLANKPDLVQISLSGNQIQVSATTPGFLGLAIKSTDGNAARYVGLYIADPVTHVVPDTVTGYLPVGSVTNTLAEGAAFLENFNFRPGVAPIDYLYIYDQGGADYTDGNLAGLLTQAVRHGVVPVVVYYNIQNVWDSAGKSTGVVEGQDAAYQAINNYSLTGTAQAANLFDGYMGRYYAKLQTDFGTMNNLGVPVQVVMEPDFLSYMMARKPGFQQNVFVPVDGDRTLNTAQVSSMYDRGLLTRGVDPDFPDTVAGMVQAINHYVGSRTPNLRIGWKTNIWSVADQQNWSLGLLHMTDARTYPWQGKWTSPAPDWAKGRDFIARQVNGLAAFLDKVGVTYWQGAADRAPFVAIDKYGVDGGYTFDPALFTLQTAAFGDLIGLVSGAKVNIDNLTDADSQKYFGLSKAEFQAFTAKYATAGYDTKAPDVQAVFTTLQNAVKADPNLAMWFFNADQWNNYLFFVKTLSDGLDGTKVMLWQIPQGHINGSTTLAGRDLTNTLANFEDSATSYFFGDTFTATGGRLAHFSADLAGDPLVSDSGNTVTWGEHMTLAQNSGALSVLFGAGLGISTRGSPTPAGEINDLNFWFDKATGYLRGVA